MSRGPTFDYDKIRVAFNVAPGRFKSEKVRHVATEFGCSIPTVIRSINEREHSSSPNGPAALGGTRTPKVLPVGHPATMEGRTVFTSMVLDVRDEWLLKSGDNSAKIGKTIVKGPWKGFPIYTLTLEERATCPVSCRHWASCYGNSTHYARRWRHGAALEWRLSREIAALELDYPKGFAVRLHNLGDFYSVGYVELWRGLLELHPALHCFGFTARIDTQTDDIAYALALLVRDNWPRFAIRFSNAEARRCATVSIESPVSKPKDAFICPAQWTPSGKKTECCATCGLCWGTTRRVAFLQH